MLTLSGGGSCARTSAGTIEAPPQGPATMARQLMMAFHSMR